MQQFIRRATGRALEVIMQAINQKEEFNLLSFKGLSGVYPLA
ncbi:hypothetical protein EPYR_01984 [Erwinia pyrifoliae DSM 12163]|nr:hypothetical protein EPYR_01984 [Erwinia pyrifoliae DSM 12163]